MTDTAKAVAQNRLTIQSVQQAWSTSTMKPTTTARIITQAIEALAQPVPVQERDPSDAGWGATVYRVTGGRAPKEILAAALRWTPAERQLHVTTKEALGHLSGAPPPGYQCNHPSVRFNTDSMGLAEQQQQADYQHQATTFLASRGIFYQAEHIPGVHNIRADFLSRHPDPEDYQLRRDVFRRACATFGVRMKVDLFANRYNRQLNQFYSMRPDPRALGVNALVQMWDTKTVLYANPPWSLIPDFLRKVDASRATVLAVLPV